jgi:hypothetical protein
MDVQLITYCLCVGESARLHFDPHALTLTAGPSIFAATTGIGDFMQHGILAAGGAAGHPVATTRIEAPDTTVSRHSQGARGRLFRGALCPLGKRDHDYANARLLLQGAGDGHRAFSNTLANVHEFKMSDARLDCAKTLVALASPDL